MTVVSMRKAILKALMDLRAKVGPNEELDRAIQEIERQSNE